MALVKGTWSLYLWMRGHQPSFEESEERKPRHGKGMYPCRASAVDSRHEPPFPTCGEPQIIVCDHQFFENVSLKLLSIALEIFRSPEPSPACIPRSFHEFSQNNGMFTKVSTYQRGFRISVSFINLPGAKS
jgi:hypothetical protein